MRFAFFLFPLAGILPVGLVLAQTNVENSADPYIHEQTNMVFPAMIAGSTRHQVVRYNADGSDSGIGYQVARNGKMMAYAGERWLVAYRATSPRGVNALPAVTELMHKLVWPDTLKR